MEQKTTLTEERGYYVDPKVHSILMRSKVKVINENLDRVFIIDGREGEGGKSTLATQLAYDLDPTLSIDRICFKAQEFEDAIRKAKKGQAVIFDEAFNGLSSKGALSNQNKRIIRLLQEVRQQNLFIFIVLPSIFLLEKYVAIFRSQVLFHCYCSKKSTKRRYFKIFNYNKKKLLYIYGKALMSYSKPRNFESYRFYSKLPPTLDEKEYKRKKSLAFHSDDDGSNSTPTKPQSQRTLLSYLLHEKFRVSYKEQSDYLTMNSQPHSPHGLSQNVIRLMKTHKIVVKNILKNRCKDCIELNSIIVDEHEDDLDYQNKAVELSTEEARQELNDIEDDGDIVEEEDED